MPEKSPQYSHGIKKIIQLSHGSEQVHSTSSGNRRRKPVFDGRRHAGHADDLRLGKQQPIPRYFQASCRIEGIPSISGKIPPLAPVSCVLIHGGGAAMAEGH